MAIAAGTVNPSGDGFIYHYEDGFALGQVAIADPPKWLLDWLLYEDQKRRVASNIPLRPQQFDGKLTAWARKVIDSELNTLIDATEGSRNDSLSRAAFKFGQLAAGGEASGSELLAALHGIADSWPGERAKSADTIARCFQAGSAYPRQRPLRNVVWVEPPRDEARP
jgi:hypothetical protein